MDAGVLVSIGSTHPVVQRLLFPPLSKAVKSPLCPPAGLGHLNAPLNTSVKRSLWPLKPETSASALAMNIHYLMTLLSPRGNTEPVCPSQTVMCPYTAFSPCSHPSTLGLGSKEKLTNQLSEESSSPAD